MKLAAIVAEMRELGVTHYEHQDSTHSFKISLGPEPTRPSADAGEVSGGPGAQAPAWETEKEPQNPPDAFRRLPLNYQNSMLYGGKLPDLGTK